MEKQHYLYLLSSVLLGAVILIQVYAESPASKGSKASKGSAGSKSDASESLGGGDKGSVSEGDKKESMPMPTANAGQKKYSSVALQCLLQDGVQAANKLLKMKDFCECIAARSKNEKSKACCEKTGTRAKNDKDLKSLIGKGANIEPEDMKDLDSIQQENFKDFDDCMKKGAEKYSDKRSGKAGSEMIKCSLVLIFGALLLKL